MKTPHEGGNAAIIKHSNNCAPVVQPEVLDLDIVHIGLRSLPYSIQPMYHPFKRRLVLAENHATHITTE